MATAIPLADIRGPQGIPGDPLSPEATEAARETAIEAVTTSGVAFTADPAMPRIVQIPGVGYGAVDAMNTLSDLAFDHAGALLPGTIDRIAARLPAAGGVSGLSDRIKLGRGMVVPGHDKYEPVTAVPDKVFIPGDSMMAGFPRPPFVAGVNAVPDVLQDGWEDGTVTSVAVEGYSADEIALRQGGWTLVGSLTGGQIPASGSVTVTTTQIFGWRLDRTWSMPVTVSSDTGTEVLCNLSRAIGGALSLTRLTAGTALPATGPRPLLSTAGEAGKESVQVILAGRNDVGYASPAGPEEDRIIAAYMAMMTRGGVREPRRLIIPPLTSTAETSGTANHAMLERVRTILDGLYPGQVYDLHDYLVTQAIHDLGITPTSADVTAMAGDTLPPSIMVDAIHYTPATAALVAERIREQLDARQWIA